MFFIIYECPAPPSDASQRSILKFIAEGQAIATRKNNENLQMWDLTGRFLGEYQGVLQLSEDGKYGLVNDKVSPNTGLIDSQHRNFIKNFTQLIPSSLLELGCKKIAPHLINQANVSQPISGADRKINDTDRKMCLVEINRVNELKN